MYALHAGRACIACQVGFSAQVCVSLPSKNRLSGAMQVSFIPAVTLAVQSRQDLFWHSAGKPVWLGPSHRSHGLDNKKHLLPQPWARQVEESKPLPTNHGSVQNYCSSAAHIQTQRLLRVVSRHSSATGE